MKVVLTRNLGKQMCEALGLHDRKKPWTPEKFLEGMKIDVDDNALRSLQGDGLVEPVDSKAA